MSPPSSPDISCSINRPQLVHHDLHGSFGVESTRSRPDERKSQGAVAVLDGELDSVADGCPGSTSPRLATGG